MPENIVIFGAGPHSKVVIDILVEHEHFNIVGVIDSLRPINDTFYGHKIIGRQNELLKLAEKFDFNAGIVAIGDNYSREKIVQDILKQSKDFKFVNAISGFSKISPSVKIGKGNVIMPGVIVNSEAVITNHCLLNTQSVLEHDSMMDDYASLSVGVITGGYCRLGRYSAICIGATILDRITIGENVVVGSGSLVTTDLESHGLYYGSPAKRVRDRKPFERFLK